jgi:hypothetical protein
MRSGIWKRPAEELRMMEERYADGTLLQTMGPERLGEYYECHLSDHAKDLEAALENCMLRSEQDELRGLLAGVTYALDKLDGKGGHVSLPTFSAQDSGRGQSRSADTPPSLAFDDSSSPEDMCSPEPPAAVVVGNAPVQRLVEDGERKRGSPGRERRYYGYGWCHALKQRVGAFRFRSWRLPKGKKEAREKEVGEKAGIKPSSGSQQEEGRRKLGWALAVGRCVGRGVHCY